MNVFKQKSWGYLNGCVIKFLRNKKVSLTRILDEKKETMIKVEFVRADISDEDYDKHEEASPGTMSKFKGKNIKYTKIFISEEGAAALHACLIDYFSRVKPQIDASPETTD